MAGCRWSVRGLLARGFLGGLGGGRRDRRRLFFAGFRLGRGAGRAAAARRRLAARRPRIDERDRLVQRDGLGRLVGRQRGIDAVVADIGAVAAGLGHDRAALVRVLAARAAGIGAETAFARTLGDLVGDQRHRPVLSDREHVVAGLEIGVGLAVLHIGTEAPDAGQDRLAVVGMLADLARQREEAERAGQIDIVG